MRQVFLFLACAILAACARPLPPAYDGSFTAPVLEPGFFIASDGSRLPLRTWQPDNGKPKAILIGVHGMNDYSNAFAMPAAWFAERGIATYAYDQRGFGAGPFRGRWAGTRAMTSDLGEFMTIVRALHPEIPMFVIGLSMGGAVVLAAAQEGHLCAIDGAILVAPAVWGWKSMNPLYKSTLWITAHTWPSKTLTGARLKIWPSDNIEMLRAFSSDPLVLKATRVDTIYGLVKLMDEGNAGAVALTAPTLLLYGNKDAIMPSRPVEEVADRLGGAARFVIYENGYHMLLRDLQRERVWRDILVWMDDRSAALPSFAGSAPPVAKEKPAGRAIAVVSKNCRG